MRPADAPLILALSPLVALCAACSDEPLASAHLALEAACIASVEDAPADAWMCGDDRVEECVFATGSHPGVIYVVPDDPATCDAVDPAPDDAGPFGPGEHVLAVYGDADGAAGPLCVSTLTVVDTAPPVATAHDLELWPPNHAFHEVTPLDCVEVHDACDPDVEVAFTWITSDEPHDAAGDGHTAVDVDLASGAARLRAERLGGGDGRVYTLGWVAADQAGHHAMGTCRVLVPHDASGGAPGDDGVAWVQAVDVPFPLGGATVSVTVEDGAPVVHVAPTVP